MKQETEGQATGSNNTAVLVMDPQNGDVLAMASYPNFDLNNPKDLSAYFTEEELAGMSDEDKMNQLNKLWQNYTISNTFEPGSTFKPFTEAMGLDSGSLRGMRPISAMVASGSADMRSTVSTVVVMVPKTCVGL